MNNIIVCDNQTKQPIGIIPDNVVIKRDGSTISTGCHDFSLLNIEVNGQNAELVQIIRGWIADAKKENQQRIARNKRIDELKAKMIKLDCCTIQLTETSVRDRPFLLSVWQKGARIVEFRFGSWRQNVQFLRPTKGFWESIKTLFSDDDNLVGQIDFDYCCDETLSQLEEVNAIIDQTEGFK